MEEIIDKLEVIPRIIASSQDTNCKRPVQVRLGANLCRRGELFIDCTPQHLSTLEHSGNRERLSALYAENLNGTQT